jgi:hypothetical protein
MKHDWSMLGGVADAPTANRDVTVCGVTMNECPMKFEFHIIIRL